MTQAFSACIALILNLSALGAATHFLTKIVQQNAEEITTLWRAEYHAHVCGRALSALANVHGAATMALQLHPSKKKIVAVAEQYFRQKLIAKYAQQFELSDRQCFNLHSHNLIAEVYLRNSDASKVNDPNYGYRLVLNSPPHPPK